MDPAVMLTLASIIYRGCNLNLSDSRSQGLARDAMVRCLNSFDKVKGQWELIWGPAGFSPGIAGLDVSAMYLARQIGNPSQVAVVIRGTNFYSLTDWMSNLLIDQEPWPYVAGTDAKVSRSTLLGLHILQRLLSSPPGTNSTESVWSEARSWFTSHEARLGYLFLRLLGSSDSGSNLDPVGAVAGWLGSVSRADLSSEALNIVHRIDEAVTNASSSNVDQTAILARVELAQQKIDSGVSMIDFLRPYVANVAGPVDIHVTGHSKGGPLAVALAAWLADTQGPQPSAHDEWDRSTRAKIHTYTFAAPTPGNSAFAAHFRSRSTSSYRLFNPLDLVPHVWNVTEARGIPDMYSGRLKFLSALVDALTPTLTALGYEHETTEQAWGESRPEHDDLFQEIAFEHLDAYLRQQGILGGDLSFVKLFEPLT